MKIIPTEFDKLAVHGGKPICSNYPGFTHPRISDQAVAFLKDRENIGRLTVYDNEYISILQQKLQDWFDLKYAVVTNSGTSALLELYHSLNLEPDDEVIVPAYTFFATATPLIPLRCTPVLADCDALGNISASAVEKRITKKTKAIMVTHIWGIPCDMDALRQVADRHKLKLIEDSSHAHGAIYKGKKVGSFSDGSAWSLGTKKILTGGQGGFIGTNDRETYEHCLLLGHANNKRMNDIKLEQNLAFAVSGTGLNLRMHPFSAYMILDQLGRLSEQMNSRREVAEYYLDNLKGISGLTMPEIPVDVLPSWYAFPIAYNEDILEVPKEQFVAAVNAEGAPEVDIPGSTCSITAFKLFSDFQENLMIFEKALFYQKRLIKLPVWYGEEGLFIAETCVQAINKVLSKIDDLKA